MAEFKEVIKQYHRMCKSMSTCAVCKMTELSGDSTIYCRDLILHKPQEVEEMIMKWAEEHPAKTNADVLREMFGIELHLQDCVGVECPVDVNGKRESCSDCDFKDFWEREYVEPSKDN